MKKKIIFVISAQRIYPVGNPGAVVLANNAEEALFMVRTELLKPKITQIFETKISLKDDSKVLFCNSTDY